MNLESATNDQLWNIIEDDKDCPPHLMKSIILEALDRELFDYLIFNVMERVVNRHMLHTANLDKDDLLQMGRVCIYRGASLYTTGTASFKTYAYHSILNRFLSISAFTRSNKGQALSNAHSLYNDVYEETLPSYTNVEKQVLFKIEWEEAMSKLTDHEKELISCMVRGYTQRELGKYHGVSMTTIMRRLRKAFRKINPSCPKINMQQLLMTRKVV